MKSRGKIFSINSSATNYKKVCVIFERRLTSIVPSFGNIGAQVVAKLRLHTEVFTQIHFSGDFAGNNVVGYAAGEDLTRIHDIGKIADL